MPRLIVCIALTVLAFPPRARAQTMSQRGFVEGRLFAFPQDAPNDRTHLVGAFLAREEVFAKPAPWMQVAAGIDLRADSHDQVDAAWRLDFTDRGTRRPALSVRRLAATLHYRRVTVDAGKQFIRWGKADIVTPTDHFAPRDFLNVVDAELLAVTGVRAVVLAGAETFEFVIVPQFTPSRVPLLDQRWTAVPAEAANLRVVDARDAGEALPKGVQTGVRWGHAGAGYEYSLSYFDGFNHLPNIEAGAFSPGQLVLRRVYPAIRSYGADAAVPTPWFTIKVETAYVTAASPATDEYVLYVVQLERQTGEWVFVGGYAGEVVTERRAALTFAPDRGMTRSIVARASYTIDPSRTVAFETAVRQDGGGVYARSEYSQAQGQHWRTTAAASVLAGRAGDFLGQYRRNSHLTLAVRYSF